MLYFTFWDFVVAYVTISGGLVSKFVSELVSIMSSICLYPSVFYDPVFFLQCSGLLSYFFYEMILIFLVFERVQVILLSVCIIIVLGMFLFIFIVCIACSALTIAICSA